MPIRVAVLALVALALGACSAPSADAPYRVTFDVQTETDQPVLAAGLALTRPEAAPAAFVELESDTFIGAMTGVADGRFTMTFPEGDTLPAGSLVHADDALAGPTGCSVVVDPAAARISRMTLADGVATPAPFGVLASGLPESMTVTDPSVVDDLRNGAPGVVHAWVFADRDVTLGLEGATCATEAAGVALARGWNQVAWSLVQDGETDTTTATLRRSTATGLVVVVLDAP